MDKTKTERLKISGMTCTSCQTRVEKALRNVRGVRSASASYSGGYADVTYNPETVKPDAFRRAIEGAGYELSQSSNSRLNLSNVTRAAALLAIIAALYLLMSQLKVANSFPLAETNTGYAMLFVIGLLTSVHCVAMCGGINMSQCIPQNDNPFRASALYNLGRVASYTFIGAAVGGLGMVITPNGAFRGVVQLIAGAFMIIMGVNMLGIFPILRKLTPRMPLFIAKRINAHKSNSPLIVGLLNGLMPCGPLQAMQLYALSTGSPVKGAVAMFLFSIGTVPLMFGLGAVSSLLTKKFSKKLMTAGAVLVAVLGLTMFTQGIALSGSHTVGNIQADNSPTVETQLIASTLRAGVYPKITVKKDAPVKWTITAPKGSINGCNQRFYIPEYDITHTFQTGENVIEFTPTKAGSFTYSCWMGMIRGTIVVE